MQKKTPKRVLGIDYGMSRIGLAISDENQSIALPLFVVKAEKQAPQTIKNLLQAIEQINSDYECEIIEIIVGLPLMMNGTVGTQALLVKNFFSLFSEKSPLKVIMWDERLTTAQADKTLREGNFNRKQRAKHIDTVSATLILQSFLDQKFMHK